jgi:hypothetical protein
VAGDYPTAGALADQGLKLAQRAGNPTFLARSYWFQLGIRFFRGDLTGAEQHFRAGLEFVDDPLFKQNPIGGPVDVFCTALSPHGLSVGRISPVSDLPR